MKFQDLGSVLWLASTSPLHQSWPIEVLVKFILPALQGNQYLLLKDQHGNPVGYASWALMSVEAEVRYIKQSSALSPEDWRSGDRLWIIDLITPFGHGNYMVRILKNHFKNHVARALRVKRGCSIGKIVEFRGGALSHLEASKILDSLFEQYQKAL